MGHVRQSILRCWTRYREFPRAVAEPGSTPEKDDTACARGGNGRGTFTAGCRQSSDRYRTPFQVTRGIHRAVQKTEASRKIPLLSQTETMDDVPVQKIIFIVTMVEKSLGNPINHKLFYGNDFNFEMEDVERLRYLWEREHAEMEVYQAKGTEFTASDHNATTNESTFNHNVESWSLVLYLICFLVLIIFFLLISIMEVCCKRTVLNVPAAEEQIVGGSPPPYDLFGPPSYDSLYDTNVEKRTKQNKKCSIFFIHLPKRKSNLNVQGRENPSIQVQEDVSPPPPP